MSRMCWGAAAICCSTWRCGVAAALAQAFANPASHVPMVGASGAIAGVLGAYLLLYPCANVHCFVWIVIFFRIVTVPAWIMLGLWFAMQLVSGLRAAPAGRAWRSGRMSAGLSAAGSGRRVAAARRPLLQPPRSQVFASAPPGGFAGRRSPPAARSRKRVAGSPDRAARGNELSFEGKMVVPGRRWAVPGRRALLADWRVMPPGSEQWRDLTHPALAGWDPPSPAMRERGFQPRILYSPSPALRERVASAARRVRVVPRFRSRCAAAVNPRLPHGARSRARPSCRPP